MAKSVLIFLGIPLIAGYLSAATAKSLRGRAWYESTFLPRIGPWALYGLLFTIVILFALQGRQVTSHPWDVARIRAAAAGLLRGSCGAAATHWAPHRPSAMRAHPPWHSLRRQ